MPVPSTIVGLSCRALDVRMKKPFGIAGGAQAIAANVLVEVTLAGGVRGWGEGAPFPAFNGETQADVLAACARLAGTFPGGDVEDTAKIEERLADERARSASAICAIETAVVDARARLRGTSVRAMLGGAETRLTTDITITTGSVADAEREAREFFAFSTLKIKVGGGDLDRDVARVLAVRAARPDAKILVDANAGFTVDEAIRFAAAAKGAGIALYEQPIPPGDWEALAFVRRETGLRIAIDESVTREQDVESAKAHGAADAANAKIMKSGVFEVLRIVEAARRGGLDRMIGGMVETRLAMAMSASIAAGIGAFSVVDLDTPLFLAEDPFAGGYVQDGERLDLGPITQGLGTTPAADQLRGAQREADE